ncbi:4257_t:CDS:1, partial [Scutellospora calospora]
HNNPVEIVNMLLRHSNPRSVTGYGVFKFNIRKEAERLGIEDSSEINTAMSKLWGTATATDKNQYKTLAINTNALLRRRAPRFRNRR